MSLAGNTSEARLEAALQQWVDTKSYRIPDTTLVQTATRLGVQSVILYRYFARKGIDFRSWRSRLRLQDAMQELLSFPDDSVSLIAHRVGFTDRSNFCRQFKEFTGQTPEIWRKNQK